MQIPAKIIQGDTVTWQDFPARDGIGNVIDGSWTLTWYFAGPSTLQVTSVADGTGWRTTLTAAQTDLLVAATSREPNYSWQARATKGDLAITVGNGQLRVDAGLAGANAGFDGRSPAERDLAAVQAAIRARINGGAVAEYMIGTRRLRNEPLSELTKLESRFKLIVAKERRARMRANGLGDPRHTYVRFT